MEVVGWRAFRGRGDGTLLASAYNYEWTPGPNTATCWSIRKQGYVAAPNPQGCDPCPGENCLAARQWGPLPQVRGCGFYAWMVPPPECEDRGQVLGLIMAWGRVIEHERGFRAQHAQIAALCSREVYDGPLRARAYAVNYGVPCVGYKTFCDRAFASGFGDLVG